MSAFAMRKEAPRIVRVAVTASACLLLAASCSRPAWTAAERATLWGLSLSSLPPLPPDPSNAVADRLDAAELGQRLFFDPRLSADGKVSCAHCHQPALRFTDGLPLGRGQAPLERHTPSLVGSAYSPWQFWDGRADSQWAQVLGPMEHPKEMGLARTEIVRRVGAAYGDAMRAIFGSFPILEDRDRFPADAAPREDDPRARAAWEAMAPEDRVTVDRAMARTGKVIAAYERRLLPGPAPFDRYVAALDADDPAAADAILSRDARAGAALFIGKAQCVNCHNGPRLTNDEFHNIGLPLLAGASSDVAALKPAFDMGREQGVLRLLADPFNCLGTHSDADKVADCTELRFVKSVGDTLPGAFKVPSLRGVNRTAPYMHDGRFQTLTQVVAHYNAAPVPVLGHSDLKPLLLSVREQEQLVAFLESLDGAFATEERWLRPPAAAAPRQNQRP